MTEKVVKKGTDKEKVARPVPPPVNLVLNHDVLAPLHPFLAPAVLVDFVREEIKHRVVSGEILGDTAMERAGDVAQSVLARSQSLLLKDRAVVNGTGIIIHTGWGNAKLHTAARRRLMEASGATATGPAMGPSRLKTLRRHLAPPDRGRRCPDYDPECLKLPLDGGRPLLWQRDCRGGPGSG